MPRMPQQFVYPLLVGLLTMAVLSPAGCSKKDRPKVYPCMVKGTVTLDGKQLDSGTVTFLPAADEEDGGRVGLGKIEANGSYWLGNSNRSKAPGVPVGSYVVTVLAEEIAPPSEGSKIRSKIPEGYQKESTTPFHYDLKAGDTVIDLELKSDFEPKEK